MVNHQVADALQICRWCDKVLCGQQTMYCSNTCKARQNAFDHAMDRLAELPEPEFRELLREVCLRRYFRPEKQGGRLHLRWGFYRERKPEESWLTEARRQVLLAADAEVLRTPSGFHLFHGWRAKSVSWIAGYLRKLDRSAKLERERKEREARRG